jgi:hypothetical protein
VDSERRGQLGIGLARCRGPFLEMKPDIRLSGHGVEGWLLLAGKSGLHMAKIRT